MLNTVAALVHTDPELDAERVQVLALRPLVENAVTSLEAALVKAALLER